MQLGLVKIICANVDMKEGMWKEWVLRLRRLGIGLVFLFNLKPCYDDTLRSKQGSCQSNLMGSRDLVDHRRQHGRSPPHP